MADDNNNVAVERWWQEVGGLLWGKGARSLVIIDHVNKNEENRGRYSSGSKRKLEGADVALSVQLLKRLQRNPSQEGLLKLTVCKDRPGWLERPYPGLVKFEFTEEGLISCALTPAAPRSEEKPDSFRPTKLMERVSRAVESSPGVSKNQVEKNVQGRAEWVRKSVDYLVQDGYVRAEDGARGAVLLTSIKPYREEETTSSPHLVRPRPDFVPDEVLRPRPTSSPPYRGDEVAGRSQFNNQERDLVPEEEGWSGEVPW
jgi:hypothetical protein